jgi:ABC-type branched-subunit amino acid transport system ATPase component
MSGAMSGAGPSQARLLEVRGLNSYYGDSHILFDVSLRVERNEVVALLGRNGAGKSTTLKSLMGVVTPRAAPAVAARAERPTSSSVCCTRSCRPGIFATLRNRSRRNGPRRSASAEIVRFWRTVSRANSWLT